MPTLIDASGRPTLLGSKIDTGGEGTVFALRDDANRVAKVYHNPPDDRTVAKLRALIRLTSPTLSRVAAWPEALVFDAASRRAAGFVMPRLADSQPIQHLYNPAQRLKYFPMRGWNFQVRAARNCAAAFEEVHKAGCIIGDVNQSNAFVAGDATVRLIDCDSFQVTAGGERFLCGVGVPHYTSPELQGHSFKTVVRTDNHDRFGLAVLVFQFLFLGRHPYAGQYNGADDPTFQDHIARYHFAYGPTALANSMGEPPHGLRPGEIPPGLFGLFRRAFEAGSALAARPGPAEWVAALARLEGEMTTCFQDHGHFHWNGIVRCPWCRLARGGPEYFAGVDQRQATFTLDEAGLRDAMVRLEAAGMAEFPAPPLQPRGPLPEPAPLPDTLLRRPTVNQRSSGSAGSTLVGEFLERRRVRLQWIAILAAACGGGIALAVIGGRSEAISFIGRLIGGVMGVWTAVLVAANLWEARVIRQRFWVEVSRRRVVHESATSRLAERTQTRSSLVTNYRATYSELRREADRVLRTRLTLPDQFRRKIAESAESLRRQAMSRHMQFHAIASAEIDSVADKRKRTLADFGILTAFEATEENLFRVPGFGAALVSRVLLWRQGVEATFHFDPTRAVDQTRRQSIIADLNVEQTAMLADLRDRAAGLASLSKSYRSKIAEIDRDIQSEHNTLRQADADLIHAQKSYDSIGI